MKKVRLYFCSLILTYFLLAQLSVSAQRTFQKIYNDPNLAQLLQTDSKGNSYVAYMNSFGDNMVVVKFDTAGNVIWDRNISNTSIPILYGVTDMQIINDDKIVLLCNSDHYTSYTSDIFCLDSTGQKVFFELIGDTLDAQFQAGNIIADSTGFTISFSIYSPTYASLTNLMKFDENGSSQATQLITDSFSNDAVAKIREGGYLLFNELHFTKLDQHFANAQRVYTYYSNYADSMPICTSMLTASDTGSFFLGVISVGMSAKPFIGHLTKDFICDWMKIFNFSLSFNTVYQFTDAHQLSDNSWIILGTTTTNVPGFSFADYFMIHTDDNFNLLKMMSTENMIFSDGPSSSGSLTKSGFLDDRILFLMNHVDSAGVKLEFVKTDSSFSGMCISESSVSVSTVLLDTTAGDFVTRTSLSTSDTALGIVSLNYALVSGNLPQALLCDTLLSIMENKEKTFSIFPNPATNQLTIHTSSFHNEAVTVLIMNVLGQEASPPAPLHMERGDALIDVSKLAAGIYFVQLKSESGSVVGKFVKE